MKLLALIILIIYYPQQSILDQGLEQESNGNYKEALDTWESAFNEYQEPSFSVAREYIRVTTEHRLIDYYVRASEMYTRSLINGIANESNLENYINELEFIRPLMSRDNEKAFINLKRNRNPLLGRYIAGFWNQLDPTPGTEYNERLIEHWERIAISRNTYTKNDKTVYGTDERGIVFIKYGFPDKVFKGSLLVSATDITQVCILFNRCDIRLMSNFIRSYDPHPKYEIWIYDRIDLQLQDNFIVTFAESNSMRFQRVQSIEEVIPIRFFSLNERRNNFSSFSGPTKLGTMSPAMVLQWVYYQELSTYDPYFGKKVTKMDTEWQMPTTVPWDNASDQISTHGLFQGQHLNSQTQNEMVLMEKVVPDEATSLFNKISEVQSNSYQYRFFDEDQNHYYAIFVKSNSYEAIAFDLINRNRGNFIATSDSLELLNELSNYTIEQGIVLQNPYGEILKRYSARIGIELESESVFSSENMHTISLPNYDVILQTFTELKNLTPSINSELNPPFLANVKGIGSSNIELMEPIEWDSEELIVGDIIIGYNMNYDLANDYFIPFKPSHIKEIPTNELLAFHFQLYNFDLNNLNEHNIQLSVQITKSRSFQWLRGTAKEVGISASYVGDEFILSENLEIQTRELLPGKYTLELEFKDLNSGKSISRNIDFTIIDLN